MSEKKPKRENKAIAAAREVVQALNMATAELPPAADAEDLLRALERQGLRVYRRKPTSGYPAPAPSPRACPST